MNDLAQELRAIVDPLVTGPPPIEQLHARVAHRRRRRERTRRGAGAIVLVAGVFGVAMLATNRPTDHDSRVQATDRSVPARFVPPTRRVANHELRTQLTLPDGSGAELTYPDTLDLASRGFRGAASIAWPVQDAPSTSNVNACCGRPLEIRHGTVVQYFGAAAPSKVYTGVDGRPVAFYAGQGDADSYLVFQFGSWVVSAYDYNPAGRHGAAAMTDGQRATFAASIRATITHDGFLVLHARAPLRLEAADQPAAQLGEDFSILIRGCSASGTDITPTGYRVEERSSGQLWLCTSDGLVIHASGSEDFLTTIANGLRVTRSTTG